MHQPDHLKNAGLKSTLPRLKVLDLFENGAERHLSAEDVYKQLLSQFEQAGLLVRHHFEGGKSVFELNQGEHHDHIVCLQCGHVEEFYDAAIETRQEKVATELGFAIRDHSLHIYADCTRKKCPHRR
jgi:Fur family transcriptional regulator, ferric uptake regulator